ncbi:MAG: hypothetical protein NC123_16080 [Butyrivibrio sp.]|nr:hypothetical protein [Acetatifactor muris]MCM1561038.1 hypothetical protein [Butyrivibrio sp.]
MYFQSDLYRRYISGVSQGADISNIRNEDIEAIKIREYSDVEQVKIAKLLQMITNIIRHQKNNLLRWMNNGHALGFVEAIGIGESILAFWNIMGGAENALNMQMTAANQTDIDMLEEVQ